VRTALKLLAEIAGILFAAGVVLLIVALILFAVLELWLWR
jgi:hypothetical protein